MSRHNETPPRAVSGGDEELLSTAVPKLRGKWYHRDGACRIGLLDRGYPMAADEQDHTGRGEEPRPADTMRLPKQWRWTGYCGVAFFSLVLVLYLLGVATYPRPRTIDGVLNVITWALIPLPINVLGLTAAILTLRMRPKPVDRRHLSRWFRVVSFVFVGAFSATMVASLLLGRWHLIRFIVLCIGLVSASALALVTLAGPRLWRMWGVRSGSCDRSEPGQDGV